MCAGAMGPGQDNGISANAALPVLQSPGGPGSARLSPRAGGGFGGIAPAAQRRPRGHRPGAPGIPQPGGGLCPRCVPGEGSQPWGCAQGGVPALRLCPGRGPCPQSVPGGALSALGLCPGRAPCLRSVPGGALPALGLCLGRGPSPRSVSEEGFLPSAVPGGSLSPQPGRSPVPARGLHPRPPSPAKGGSGKRGDQPETPPIPARAGAGDFPGREGSGKAQVGVPSWGSGRRSRYINASSVSLLWSRFRAGIADPRVPTLGYVRYPPLTGLPEPLILFYFILFFLGHRSFSSLAAVPHLPHGHALSPSSFLILGGRKRSLKRGFDCRLWAGLAALYNCRA